MILGFFVFPKEDDMFAALLRTSATTGVLTYGCENFPVKMFQKARIEGVATTDTGLRLRILEGRE